MPRLTLYDHVAGLSIERLAALSDGVFAVAMTLLVLDLRAPAADAVHSERDMLHAVLALAPQLLAYLMSFLTLGIFWLGQQTQIDQFARGDRNLVWIHLAFLFAVTLMPFSTILLARFMVWRVALLLYWANILLLGVILFASWSYARHAGLIGDDAPPEIDRAVRRRILIAQGLYALGAALCLVNTTWSVAFIVLVQLHYAIWPKLG
ncbi:MAG TPA: TMEM175 family protein [Rhizomicrobium sp.]|jgi:uncharacterized membrane protein